MLLTPKLADGLFAALAAAAELEEEGYTAADTLRSLKPNHLQLMPAFPARPSGMRALASAALVRGSSSILPRLGIDLDALGCVCL